MDSSKDLLKPKGILSISELAGDPHKMTPGELKTLVTDARFVFDKMFGTQGNYTINFRA